MALIKTPEEIEILRECGKRLATIVHKLSKMLKPGVLTSDIENEARRLIKEGGDSAPFLNYTPQGASRPFPAALCLSINDEIIHGIPNENPREIQEGDIVTLDLGLKHKGLITDHARTFAVGEIPKETQKLLTVTEEALRSGIKAARGGKKVGDIGAAIESRAIDNGYSVAEGLSGHGVGHDVHEEPLVLNYGRKGTGASLRPGMVIAIEPMFTMGSGAISLDRDGYTYRTMDGSLSCQFEHTILITTGEPEILTKM